MSVTPSSPYTDHVATAWLLYHTRRAFQGIDDLPAPWSEGPVPSTFKESWLAWCELKLLKTSPYRTDKDKWHELVMVWARLVWLNVEKQEKDKTVPLSKIVTPEFFTRPDWRQCLAYLSILPRPPEVLDNADLAVDGENLNVSEEFVSLADASMRALGPDGHRLIGGVAKQARERDAAHPAVSTLSTRSFPRVSILHCTSRLCLVCSFISLIHSFISLVYSFISLSVCLTSTTRESGRSVRRMCRVLGRFARSKRCAASVPRTVSASAQRPSSTARPFTCSGDTSSPGSDSPARMT
jgi:hypothetical protein